MNRTNVVVGLGIVLCAASLFWLQQQFDASDHRKARRLVEHFRVPHRPETFGQFLQARHGAPGIWHTEITGGCRGVVRVTWRTAHAPERVYAWDVEIPSQAIHPTPASPDGERILNEFTGRGKPLEPLVLPPLVDGAPPRNN